jgi:hypothetical protein
MATGGAAVCQASAAQLLLPAPIHVPKFLNLASWQAPLHGETARHAVTVRLVAG